MNKKLFQPFFFQFFTSEKSRRADRWCVPLASIHSFAPFLYFRSLSFPSLFSAHPITSVVRINPHHLLTASSGRDVLSYECVAHVAPFVFAAAAASWALQTCSAATTGAKAPMDGRRSRTSLSSHSLSTHCSNSFPSLLHTRLTSSPHRLRLLPLSLPSSYEVRDDYFCCGGVCADRSRSY